MPHLTTALILVANNPAQGLVTAVQAFVGPILLLLIGIFALKFLFQGQIMGLITFIIIAAVVCVLFYDPQIIHSIANAFYNQTGASGWGS